MKDNRIVSLDIGEKTVGVAVTDPLMVFPRPFTTVKRSGAYKKDVQLLIKTLENLDIVAFVVGWPEELPGHESHMTKTISRFVKHLKPFFPDIEFFYQDESFSTESAVNLTLISRKNILAEKKKGSIDAKAAAFILREFMENKEFQKIKKRLQSDNHKR